MPISPPPRPLAGLGKKSGPVIDRLAGATPRNAPLRAAAPRDAAQRCRAYRTGPSHLPYFPDIEGDDARKPRRKQG